MDYSTEIKEKIFSINDKNFEEEVLKVFYYQAYKNTVYNNYIRFLKINPANVKSIYQIPFLPIAFFKNFKVLSVRNTPRTVFESSGTTGQVRSKHYVQSPDFYDKISRYIFEKYYFPLQQCVFLPLLPSYAERSGSSLVHMVAHFIKHSAAPDEKFYLNDYEALIQKITFYKQKGLKVFVFGVTFALLDLAENFAPDLEGVTVIETGGMKGRRKEMVREELHLHLKEKFNLSEIGSEYGMTELLSQAYAQKDGIFSTPPWMKILLHQPDDPFDISPNLKRGGVNVIDLANIDSCAFIETQDLGEQVGNEQFKILGRFDNSEIRGCNLLVF